MEADEVFNLFDSYWFEHGLFDLNHTHHTSPVSPVSSPVFPVSSPVHVVEHEEQPKPAATVPNLQTRSLSDRYLGVNPINFFKDEAEKQSVRTQPRLQRILSGKDVLDDFKNGNTEAQVKVEKSPKKKQRYKRKKMEKVNSNITRSLSALEFEEVKGFMDLGFVFTEEDKSSELVSIIPGLQKLGKNGEVAKEKVEKVDKVERPYLSEAWKDFKQGKIDDYKPVPMNLRIPSVFDDTHMKDHLRVWAQSVASTVKT